MFQSNKFHSLLRSTIWVLVLSLALAWPAFSKGNPASNNQQTPLIQKVRIGPHPQYTRIIVDLSSPTPYKVKADFLRKRITLTLNDVRLNPRVQTRSIKDRNLEKIAINYSGQTLEIVLHLRKINTRFFHFLDIDKSQIILDINGEKKPILQTQIGKPEPGIAPKREELRFRKNKISQPLKRFKPKKRARVAGMTPGKLRAINRQDIENKLKNGWDEYQSALKQFQKKNYPEAIESFRSFVNAFPDSKYLSQIYFLLAEAQYQIAFREPHPVYEKALTAYKDASRRFPKSKFAGHGNDRIAFIYSEMGYILEAKTKYEESLKSNPKSLYTFARKNNLALMMLREGKYEEAYAAFKRLLVKSPKNIAARPAIFEIANHYYEQKDFKRSIEVYKDGAARWPSELNEQQEINFNMGNIYFLQKKYSQARDHLFDLINLAPDHPKAHTALNMIGDSYLLEARHRNALTVFDESAKRDSGSSASQYGKIRMADIGIIDPRLKVKDIIYNTGPYYQPFQAYEEILNDAKDVEILAEVTLSRGIAFLQEQNYLKAVEEFKKLLPLGPDSRFYNKSKKYIQQALVFSVDKYSRQGGVLPILYSYSDFANLSLGKVNTLKTVMQIGEAYQAIGMFPQALRFYERVKKLDAKDLYRDRIFLNLGQIHLEQNNYKEAELVSRSFLKNYPKSPQVPIALKLLASSHTGRKQYDQALKVYKRLLIRHKENISETHYLLGETYQNLNNPPAAIREYRQAIKTFDRTARVIPETIRKAYYNLGFVLFQNRKYAEAAKALQAARQLFPEQPQTDWADYLLVESYENMKKPAKATATLNGLIQSKDTDYLLKQVAESKLKFLDWEKEFKDTL
ncbi:MAG: tetratricopeptide repeat protein [Nitrospinae bacterium]|nr:tetratricopeptide repeat protein [Nitrospinota bacterium]